MGEDEKKKEPLHNLQGLFTLQAGSQGFESS